MNVGEWAPARVSHVEQLTPTARSIRLRVPGWTSSLPGQHIDLRLTAEDGYQAVRSYSLASSGAGEEIELAVDEVPDGEVSPYLVRDVRAGDAVEVKGPLGGYFVWHDDDPGAVQLIAGGSGIVPLLAIARARAASASTAPFRLLVSVRSPADALYLDEVQRLPLSGVEVDWAYTREAPAGWTGTVGRIGPAALGRTWSPADSPTMFVCGPTGFVEAVASALVERGHDPLRVRTERFGGT